MHIFKREIKDGKFLKGTSMTSACKKGKPFLMVTKDVTEASFNYFLVVNSTKIYRPKQEGWEVLTISQEVSTCEI